MNSLSAHHSLYWSECCSCSISSRGRSFVSAVGVREMSTKLTVDELFGYKVVAFLGEGARSKLYAVKDRETGGTYTLKHVVFDESRDKDDRYLKQVETEYATLKELDHPSIRRMIALKRARPLFQVTEVALVLEMIDSATLEQDPPKSLRRMVTTFAEVAEALAHMHERGFAHADMKTGNIMMPEEREGATRAKVIDLGQSCKLGSLKPRFQGSPGYMAPEQAAKEAVVERTDIYNFGATMYRAVTREYAETVLVPGQSKSRKVEEIPPMVPAAERVVGLSRELSNLISDCLQLKMERRISSMEKVAQTLRALESTVRDIAI
ncbi:MAG: serine/threonine protein kinase [Phycisphaerales bacterium]|nr:serine/threonine protein kinase [Phycisphaerales bacterium]